MGRPSFIRTSRDQPRAASKVPRWGLEIFAQQPITREAACMTLKELREQFPSYYRTGSGPVALICGSARRITFCSENVARLFQHASCGRGCDYHLDPHHAYKIADEPKMGYTKKIREWV